MTNSADDLPLADVPEQQAKKLLDGKGLKLRVVKRDGKQLIGTQDYDTKRVNVEVVGGVVKKILGRG